MTTVTERIATITVDGSETVKFAVPHSVYGVYGEDMLVSLKQGAQAGDQGAYSTEGAGKAIIAHYTQADTLYITGSGTVTVWGGQSPLDDPFGGNAKGGGSGGGSTKYIGTTTTALSNGSTTNPITVNGESYTAQFGDIAVYNYTEFIFDGTAWGEFGRNYDTTPTFGSANAVTSAGIYDLIHKGSGVFAIAIGATSSTGTTASGGYSTAMGCATTASGAGSTAMGNHTIASQTAMTAMGKYNSPRTGDLLNIGNGSEGSLSNIVEVNSTSMNVNGAITQNNTPVLVNAGTLPSLTYDSSTEALTFSAGTLPSGGTT